MKIVKKDKTYFINYVHEDLELLDKLKDSKLEFKEITTNVYSLVINKDTSNQKEKTKEIPKQNDIKQKIISLLNDKSVSGGDKIEGNFEKLLKKEDISIFQDMLKAKEITIFHLPKYKKGIYQVNSPTNVKENSFKGEEAANKPKEKDRINPFTSAKEISQESDDILSFFEANGYIIIKNQGDAVFFSEKYENRIKSNEIIGQKSFDGSYYVIDSSNYQKIKNKLLSLKIKEAFTIDDIKLKLNYPDDELRVVLEILKEECLVIEKRKGKYMFV
jgi:hypothetical protein